MSITSEITRITNARDSSLTSVGNKGVTVPAGSKIDDLPSLIDEIDAVTHLPSVPSSKVSSIIEVSDDYYAWHEGEGGGSLIPMKMGVLRADAQLMKTYSYDKYIVADEGVTLPEYSTTAVTLKAGEALEDTYTIDYDYNWFFLYRMLTIPEYNTTSVAKGRIEYTFSCVEYEVCEIPPNTIHALINPEKYVTSRSASTLTMSAYTRIVYWSSGTAVNAYATASYGVTQAVSAAPSISDGAYTVSTPNLNIRGNSTYFASTFFNALTDIRYQWICEIYRAPRNSGTVDGWVGTTQAKHIIGCAQGTGKLT